MASAALTTTHLPTLRAQVTEWTAKQPARKGFTSAMPADGAHTDGTPEGKDVIVALRTRPPLAEETSRFIVPNADAEDVVAEGAEDATPTELEFCSGISVPSAEPGVFVAHVPAMKVSAHMI
jgi:kinesin family member 2/24